MDARKEAALRAGFGKTVVFADRGDWTDERIMRTYFARSAMEEDMHLLKDVLLFPVMPKFHRPDHRIRVHAFLCVMGLLFYRWVQLRAQEHLGRRILIDRLAALLDDVRVAAATDSQKRRTRFVLETEKDERSELVDALQLRRFVPNWRLCTPHAPSIFSGFYVKLRTERAIYIRAEISQTGCNGFDSPEDTRYVHGRISFSLHRRVDSSRLSRPLHDPLHRSSLVNGGSEGQFERRRAGDVSRNIRRA